MHQLRTTLFTINVQGDEAQQRGRLLIICAAALLLLDLVAALLLLSGPTTPATVVLLASGLIFALATGFLGRAGYVDVGALVLVGFAIAAIVGAFPAANSGATPFYMVLPILIASVLLRPVLIWGVLLLSLLGVGIGASLLPAETLARDAVRDAILAAPPLLTIVAIVLFFHARSTVRAITAARHAQATAEASARSLAAANATLEAHAELRAIDLRELAEAQRGVASQLQASLEAQQQLSRAFAELSVPIIPISAGTMIVPLVGGLDVKRANTLLASILEQVEASNAHTIVLDVTGVAVVDTHIAAALLRVADAARLMGAKTMLVGIRPEVAQTLVHLGVDLGGLRTAATLQSGLHDLGVLGER